MEGFILIGLYSYQDRVSMGMGRGVALILNLNIGCLTEKSNWGKIQQESLGWGHASLNSY
jgi:hypothetical protein